MTEVVGNAVLEGIIRTSIDKRKANSLTDHTMESCKILLSGPANHLNFVEHAGLELGQQNALKMMKEIALSERANEKMTEMFGNAVPERIIHVSINKRTYR